MENVIDRTMNEEILPTGIQEIDKAILDLHNGDFIVIASRPSVCKTSLTLNIITNTILADKNVAVFTLESSKKHYIDMLINYSLKSSPVKDIEKVKEYMLDKVHITDTPAITVEEIVNMSTTLKHNNNIKLVVIDYLQLIKHCDNTETTIKGLKAMAETLEIPVIVVSQLSRDVDTREDNKPTLDDFKESKAVVDYADVIMLLYKESLEYGTVNTIIAKNRYGHCETIKLSVIPQQLKD